MKAILKLTTLFIIILFIGCRGKEEKKKEKIKIKSKTEKKVEQKAQKIPASKQVDLSNKGIGPITSLQLPIEIDQSMVAHGADIFKKMCTACHRTDKKFIGPALQNIMQRRSPEWVMNIILNPNEMVRKDPLAKALLIEFNGSPMANQNVTVNDARALLEYFRTLK